MHDELIPWRPLQGIDAPCAAVDLEELGGQLTLLLRFSQFIGGIPRDLRLSFGRVVAVVSYEESAHPWNDDPVDQPKLLGKWSQFTFPCLEVRNSSWLASFGEARVLGYQELRHFQVVTLDKTVDVLTDAPVIPEWLDG